MPVTVLAEHAKELRFVYGLLKKRGKQKKHQTHKKKAPGNVFLKLWIQNETVRIKPCFVYKKTPVCMWKGKVGMWAKTQALLHECVDIAGMKYGCS